MKLELLEVLKHTTLTERSDLIETHEILTGHYNLPEFNNNTRLRVTNKHKLTTERSHNNPHRHFFYVTERSSMERITRTCRH